MIKLLKNLHNLLFCSGTFGRSLKLVLREFGLYKQRILTGGMDDSQTWDLFTENARWMIPRLKRFIELHVGYPGALDEQSWDEILNDILYAFEKIAEDNIFDWTKEEEERVNKGLQQYATWYMALWW